MPTVNNNAQPVQAATPPAPKVSKVEELKQRLWHDAKTLVEEMLASEVVGLQKAHQLGDKLIELHACYPGESRTSFAKMVKETIKELEYARSTVLAYMQLSEGWHLIADKVAASPHMTINQARTLLAEVQKPAKDAAAYARKLTKAKGYGWKPLTEEQAKKKIEKEDKEKQISKKLEAHQKLSAELKELKPDLPDEVFSLFADHPSEEVDEQEWLALLATAAEKWTKFRKTSQIVLAHSAKPVKFKIQGNDLTLAPGQTVIIYSPLPQDATTQTPPE